MFMEIVNSHLGTTLKCISAHPLLVYYLFKPPYSFALRHNCSRNIADLTDIIIMNIWLSFHFWYIVQRPIDLRSTVAIFITMKANLFSQYEWQSLSIRTGSFYLRIIKRFRKLSIKGDRFEWIFVFCNLKIKNPKLLNKLYM